jgi:hypothetical protein
MLVVEVIKLNRILDLLMTLDAAFLQKRAWQRLSASVIGCTMLSDVLTRKRQNATGKLTTCQSHS